MTIYDYYKPTIGFLIVNDYGKPSVDYRNTIFVQVS